MTLQYSFILPIILRLMAGSCTAGSSSFLRRQRYLRQRSMSMPRSFFSISLGKVSQARRMMISCSSKSMMPGSPRWMAPSCPSISLWQASDMTWRLQNSCCLELMLGMMSRMISSTCSTVMRCGEVSDSFRKRISETQLHRLFCSSISRKLSSSRFLRLSDQQFSAVQEMKMCLISSEQRHSCRTTSSTISFLLVSSTTITRARLISPFSDSIFSDRKVRQKRSRKLGLGLQRILAASLKRKLSCSLVMTRSPCTSVFSGGLRPLTLRAASKSGWKSVRVNLVLKMQRSSMSAMTSLYLRQLGSDLAKLVNRDVIFVQSQPESPANFYAGYMLVIQMISPILHLAITAAQQRGNKSFGLRVVVLLLGLLEQPLELCAEERVGGLQHGALPHVGRGLDQVAEANVRLRLPVDGLHVLAVLLLGLLAVEERLLELLERQVAGCDVAVDDFLNRTDGTFSGSCWMAFRYSCSASSQRFSAQNLLPMFLISSARSLSGCSLSFRFCSSLIRSSICSQFCDFSFRKLTTSHFECSNARYSGVLPSTSRFTSAPRPTRSFTNSRSPFSAATCSTEQPFGSFTLGLAPLLSSSSQRFWSLKSTARMRGARLEPVESPLGSAPWSSRTLVDSKCRLPTAQLMGLPQMETFSRLAPLEMRQLSRSTWLWLAARCSVEISPSLDSLAEQCSSSMKYLATSRWPCSMAVKKGELPSLSLTEWSTPTVSMRYRMMSRLPRATAKWSGTLPLASLRVSSRLTSEENSWKVGDSLLTMRFSRLTRKSLTCDTSSVVMASTISLQSLEISWYFWTWPGSINNLLSLYIT